jgi:hypothetical protein
MRLIKKSLMASLILVSLMGNTSFSVEENPNSSLFEEKVNSKLQLSSFTDDVNFLERTFSQAYKRIKNEIISDKTIQLFHIKKHEDLQEQIDNYNNIIRDRETIKQLFKTSTNMIDYPYIQDIYNKEMGNKFIDFFANQHDIQERNFAIGTHIANKASESIKESSKILKEAIRNYNFNKYTTREEGDMEAQERASEMARSFGQLFIALFKLFKKNS